MSKENSFLLLKKIIEQNPEIKNKMENEYNREYDNCCKDMPKKYISYLKIPLLFSGVYIIISIFLASWAFIALHENIYWLDKSILLMIPLTMFVSLFFIISLNYNNYSDFYQNKKESFSRKELRIKSVVNKFTLGIKPDVQLMEEKITYADIKNLLDLKEKK